MIELFWLLLLAPLVVGLLVQRRLRSVFARYRAVANRAGVTGAQLARTLLDAHGLGQVRLELTPGFLSDHYDGATHTLRLSEVVARERSVAAVGIAAHEVSHAYQDAEETDEIEQVLTAAALTYVVGLLQQLGLLFALVLVAETARRLAT